MCLIKGTVEVIFECVLYVLAGQVRNWEVFEQVEKTL